VLALIGEIGAGKTHFVQGIARGAGVREGTVASPTFVLVKVYNGGRFPIFHADLFRLEKAPEAATVGIEELYDEPGVTVIEWANRIPNVLPEEFLEVKFTVVDENTRTIDVIPHGKKYEERDWREIDRR
jgi:tRNA threonylcarbamoyladenosine biosynthesis protein TsaE